MRGKGLWLLVLGVPAPMVSIDGVGRYVGRGPSELYAGIES